MQNCMFRKGLVVGIIVLFISIGVQPAFAVELVKTSIIDKQVVEPKEYISQTIIDIPNNPDVKNLLESNTDYTEHRHIIINGNSDFKARNGVVGGSGTKEDPYIISGWKFDGHNKYNLNETRWKGIFFRILIFLISLFFGEVGNAITIKNTDKHLVIRNNFFKDWVEPDPPDPYEDPDHRAITLINTKNIIIENNKIEDCNEGITCEGSNVIIRNNSFTSINDGGRIIYLENQKYTIIENNYFQFCNANTAIYPYRPKDNIIIQGNLFQKSGSIQVISLGVTDKTIIIKNNVFMESKVYGIVGEKGLIENNIFEKGSIVIKLGNSIIRNNLVRSSNIAISALNSCEIYNNDVIGNNIGIGCYGGPNYPPVIVNNVISGNNKGLFCRKNIRPTVHFNNIFDNDYGLAYQGGNVLNATFNWWGAANGPSGQGPGNGDTVSADVLYDPWLTEPNPDAGRQ